MIVLGAFGGRIDHTLNSMHLLYKINNKYKDYMQDSEIILMDEFGMMRYLQGGENIIRPSKNYELNVGCGFFPLNGICEHI